VSDTLSNLEIKQGTKYIVSMRAVDLAGNYSEEASVEVTTETVADSKTSIGVSYTPTDWTQGPVTVYFENNSEDSELILKYQVGNIDGEWLDYPSAGVSVSENTVVYARLFDKVGQSSNTTATADIQKIDNVEPVKPTLTVSDITTTSIKATLTDGYDAESGIVKYTFRIYLEDYTLVDEKYIESTSDIESCDFTGLSTDVTYIVIGFVDDAVFNYNSSNEVKFTTHKHTEKCYAGPQARPLYATIVKYNGTGYNSSTRVTYHKYDMQCPKCGTVFSWSDEYKFNVGDEYTRYPISVLSRFVYVFERGNE